MKGKTSPVLRWQASSLILGMVLAGCAGLAAPDRPAKDLAGGHARPVKVLVISMFKPEAQPWIDHLQFTEHILVPGLASDYPTVHCNGSDVCQMTTGMGHTNAAASTTALIFSGKFDFSKTYFLVAGIAGIDPNQGTIGSAAWARYLIDFGLAHEIDAREMPQGWAAGYFGIHSAGPGAKPPLNYHTEVFRLDEGLLQKALALTRNIKLSDNSTASAYRAHYPLAPANQPPSVIQCDTAAGDTYWHGDLLGRSATAWTALLSDGQAVYCTTQQEDNATFEALRRGAGAGLLDIHRVAVLRTGSNFDRPYPGQSAYDSLKSSSGGFLAAINNLYLAEMPLIDDVVTNWNQWQNGVPKP